MSSKQPPDSRCVKCSRPSPPSRCDDRNGRDRQSPVPSSPPAPLAQPPPSCWSLPKMIDHAVQLDSSSASDPCYSDLLCFPVSSPDVPCPLTASAPDDLGPWKALCPGGTQCPWKAWSPGVGCPTSVAPASSSKPVGSPLTITTPGAGKPWLRRRCSVVATTIGRLSLLASWHPISKLSHVLST